MLSYNGKTVRAKGIIDTGNRLHDSFTGKPVSVIDRTLALSLMPVEYAAAAMNPSGINLPLGMHLIVSETVGGKTLMTAFDVDEMRIIMPETEFVLKKASVAVSTSTDFGTGCSVLLSADILDNISGGREYGKKHFQKTQKSVSEAEGERRSLHKRPRNPACTAERRRGTRCDGENCKR